jgi:hypothetical protein
MHQPAYNRGAAILRRIQWQPDPTGMFKAPSIAKGTPARIACESATKKSGADSELMKDLQFAACIEHLVAIGGVEAREHLLAANCPLRREQIEGLGRRMPPFIKAKLIELQNGGRFDGNPTDAFDTNGWGELRGRLPKFRSTLQHYAAMCENKWIAALSNDERTKLTTLAETIVMGCDKLLGKLRSFSPVGPGKVTVAKPHAPQVLKWSDSWKKLRAVHGVLEKCNRDLNSAHWKKEWVPTHADFERVTEVVEVMKKSAQQIANFIVAESTIE